MVGPALVLMASPLVGQASVVLNGRVEDAASRIPLPGVRIASSDSTVAVLTDSLGRFALRVDAAGPYAVYAEQYGYLSQTFELGDAAPSQISILLLEPLPAELEGISVVVESALAEVFRDLRGRRNAYQGAVRAFDREQLTRLAPAGSAWDFIRRMAPRVFECSSSRSGLCMRGRDVTFRNPFPEVPILVCVDSWESWGASSELSSLDMSSVAMVEIFSQGRGSIRLYTGQYLAHSAVTGRNVALPMWFGC